MVFDEDDFNASGGVDPERFRPERLARRRRLAAGDGRRGPAACGSSITSSSARRPRASRCGRWPDGGVLYPMSEPTLGAANAGVRIGPVIISEVQYHPSSELAWLEYVEAVQHDGRRH